MTTIVVEPGSVVTLRYTINEDCDLRWKFSADKGDIGFGVQKKEAIQRILFREEVSNYHLDLCGSEESEPSIGEPSGENVASVTSDTFMMVGQGLPEIQITDEEDKEDMRGSRKNSLLVKISMHSL